MSSSSTLATPRTPRTSRAYRKISELLRHADVEVNGSRPWDIQIHDPRVADRIMVMGAIGLGEAYMDGQWDAEAVDEFIYRLLISHFARHIHPLPLLLSAIEARLVNLQTRRRAWQVGKVHYDLGNRFFETMLDPRMTYSCGLWSGGASTLSEAQEAKLDLICRKLQLEPGMRLLDIGCGWGSLMGYAAEHYGVSCVGVSISKEQVAYAQARYADLPLDFRLQDYRELLNDSSLHKRFDRVASVGMFEHVGHKNYRDFLTVANRCLVDDGLFLLHTIGKSRANNKNNLWIRKYIFPNGEVPAFGHIIKDAGGLFVMEDLHNFGADYDPTLMAWHRNFEAAWPEFKDELGERFYRMWKFYLLSCAGAFRARNVQLWQWVFSKKGHIGGYQRPELVCASDQGMLLVPDDL